MTEFNRRTILAGGASAIAATAALTEAAEAQAGVKPIFPVAQSTIPVVGVKEVFPVRRIYCVGRNYAAHAIERGSDPTR
jgi:fumarylpyruvate hydrolase